MPKPGNRHDGWYLTRRRLANQPGILDRWADSFSQAIVVILGPKTSLLGPPGVILAPLGPFEVPWGGLSWPDVTWSGKRYEKVVRGPSF